MNHADHVTGFELWSVKHSEKRSISICHNKPCQTGVSVDLARSGIEEVHS
jgi:hypothetical protein